MQLKHIPCRSLTIMMRIPESHEAIWHVLALPYICTSVSVPITYKPVQCIVKARLQYSQLILQITLYMPPNRRHHSSFVDARIT